MTTPDMTNCNDTPSAGRLRDSDFARPARLGPLRRWRSLTAGERIAATIACGVTLLFFLIGAVAALALLMKPVNAAPVEVEQAVYIEFWA
jgi:hypothetical protein